MYTALHFACKFGSEECVRLLLDAGATAKTLDSGGLSGAVLAINYGHHHVLYLLSGDWFARAWRPETHNRWPDQFREEAYQLLLVTHRILGQRRNYKDVRLYLVATLAHDYRSHRLRKGHIKRMK